jgi:hypothetical protein
MHKEGIAKPADFVEKHKGVAASASPEGFISLGLDGPTGGSCQVTGDVHRTCSRSSGYIFTTYYAYCNVPFRYTNKS